MLKVSTVVVVFSLFLGMGVFADVKPKDDPEYLKNRL